MAQQSLAEFLGVGDPRPAEDVPRSDFEQLADVSDPQEFCQRIMKTREFRQYIMSGFVLGDIPAAVVGRIMDHALGKPVDRVEVKDVTNRLEDLTVEQLEARAVLLVGVAQRLRAEQAGVADGAPGVVH